MNSYREQGRQLRSQMRPMPASRRGWHRAGILEPVEPIAWGEISRASVVPARRPSRRIPAIATAVALMASVVAVYLVASFV